jgi:alkanesulfonate monooxygenase SsuD/methylene tetrahydromethanopterin reductase-like flavin-dependent oxidoreductase (luciferase family)
MAVGWTGSKRAPKFGFRVITRDADDPLRWGHVIAQARAAEQAGFDRVIVSGDHVVFGEHLEAYGNPALGGRPGGRLDIGPDASFPDPVVAMAVLCAVTRRVRIMNSLMLAALRRPIVLAKAVASLDAVSGGRIDLSVGIGWQREEYAAAGLDFHRRGRLLDHTLEVCQALWQQPRASYSSPDLSFEGIHMRPKPIQEGGVPLWISGNDIEVIGHLPLVSDRNGQPRLDASMENLGRLVEAGVTNVDVFLPAPTEYDAAVDYLAPWAEAFRKAVS